MAATNAAADQEESKQLVIIVSSVILMVISLIGVSLRLYTRLAIIGKVFTEDILIILGTLTAFGLSATFVTAAYTGLGKHGSQIQPEDAELLRKLGFVILLLYVLTAILTKTSFLTLYLRLDQRAPMRLTVYFLMCCVATVKITFMVVQAFTCQHPTLFWTRQDAEDGQCWSPQSVQCLYNTVSILTIVVAAAIISAPLPMLQKLELPGRQRHAVCALFALGFLPIIAGCFRCYYLWNLMKSKDINYDGAEAAIWAQAELHMVILCSSASTFKVLMKGFLPTCSPGSNASSVDPFPEISVRGTLHTHSASAGGTIPWYSGTSEDEKLSHFITSPTSTELSMRDRSWTASTVDHPITDEHGNVTYARPPRVVLHRASGDKASTPARVLLKFPSIEDRLGSGHGCDAWTKKDATQVHEQELSPSWPEKKRVNEQSWFDT